MSLLKSAGEIVFIDDLQGEKVLPVLGSTSAKSELKSCDLRDAELRNIRNGNPVLGLFGRNLKVLILEFAGDPIVRPKAFRPARHRPLRGNLALAGGCGSSNGRHLRLLDGKRHGHGDEKQSRRQVPRRPRQSPTVFRIYEPREREREESRPDQHRDRAQAADRALQFALF